MKVTTESIQSIYTSELEKNKSDLQSHLEVLELLKLVDEKPINKITFSKKILNGKEILGKYGMFYIKNGEREHLIGYRSSPFVSVKDFERFDSCHSVGARERIQKIESLDMNKVHFTFGHLELALSTLTTIMGNIKEDKLNSFNNPLYYDIMKMLCTDHKEAITEVYNRVR